MQSTPADRLRAVQDQMALACDRVHRPLDSVRLLAVTKTRPDSDLEHVYALGLRAFGENRVPEALGKQSRLPQDIEWHMIGHLQSNKAKDCLGFSWLHSLDKADTAGALEKAFGKAGTTLNVLLEANTGGEDAKDGVQDLDGLKRLTEALAPLSHLKIRGLMTMAPFSPDEAVVRPCFVRLRSWRDALAAEFPDQDWSVLSMGMTNDLGWAIEEGSTLVRIGTALFEGFR
jgi:pyridoxal phosphate enzyme (YggS family)